MKQQVKDRESGTNQHLPLSRRLRAKIIAEFRNPSCFFLRTALQQKSVQIEQNDRWAENYPKTGILAKPATRWPFILRHLFWEWPFAWRVEICFRVTIQCNYSASVKVCANWGFVTVPQQQGAPILTSIAQTSTQVSIEQLQNSIWTPSQSPLLFPFCSFLTQTKRIFERE